MGDYDNDVQGTFFDYIKKKEVNLHSLSICQKAMIESRREVYAKCMHRLIKTNPYLLAMFPDSSNGGDLASGWERFMNHYGRDNFESDTIEDLFDIIDEFIDTINTRADKILEIFKYIHLFCNELGNLMNNFETAKSNFIKENNQLNARNVIESALVALSKSCANMNEVNDLGKHFLGSICSASDKYLACVNQYDYAWSFLKVHIKNRKTNAKCIEVGRINGKLDDVYKTLKRNSSICVPQYDEIRNLVDVMCCVNEKNDSVTVTDEPKYIDVIETVKEIIATVSSQTVLEKVVELQATSNKDDEQEKELETSAVGSRLNVQNITIDDDDDVPLENENCKNSGDIVQNVSSSSSSTYLRQRLRSTAQKTRNLQSDGQENMKKVKKKMSFYCKQLSDDEPSRQCTKLKSTDKRSSKRSVKLLKSIAGQPSRRSTRLKSRST